MSPNDTQAQLQTWLHAQLNALSVLTPAVEAAKFGTPHADHPGWQINQQLPGSLQCSCGQPLDDILGLQPVKHWHIAYCAQCDMRQPFTDNSERDTWTDQHAAGTGHAVVRYEEKRFSKNKL